MVRLGHLWWVKLVHSKELKLKNLADELLLSKLVFEIDTKVYQMAILRESL
jgi:hypothetical protein